MSKPIHECKTAAEAYDEKSREVMGLLGELSAHLDRHRWQFVAEGKKGWGYAGDLAQVASLLRQALGREE